MKFKLLLSFLFLIMSAQLYAQYEQIDFDLYPYEEKCSGFYAKAFGGADWLHKRTCSELETHFKTSGFGGGALGYQFARYYRFEGEITYRKSEIKKSIFNGEICHHDSHAYTWSYMVNGFFDIPTSMDVTPYLGVGVGYMDFESNFKHKDFKKKEKTNGYAAQFIAGVSTPLSEKTDVGVEYRYFVGKDDFYDHGIALTCTYSF